MQQEQGALMGDGGAAARDECYFKKQLVPVVPTFSVHGAAGANRTVLMVWEPIRTPMAITVTGATAGRGHFVGRTKIKSNNRF